MRKFSPWALACMLCSVALVSAAFGGVDQTLSFAPSAVSATPTVTVQGRSAGVLTLEFALPSLGWQDVETDGGTVRALGIPGGGFQAGPGGVPLPTFTRLVAVPAGMTLRARVVDAAREQIAGVRLTPAPAAAAAKSSAAAVGSEPAVLVGRAAVLRDLVVVPVTFAPVTCDAAGAQVSAASRLTVELEFTPDAQAPAAPGAQPVTESFDRLYQDLVINYEAQSAPVRGAYVVICANDAVVQTNLQPLLDWRRRQGYQVVLTTTAVTGTSNAQIKAYLQGLYDTYKDPPLEFVTLAGDASGTYAVATWNESISGYNGEGDHEYTRLAGGDVLADINIGRLSFQTTDELARIVNKLVTYESNPPLAADPNWFTRGCVTGDPSSTGIATIWISQWAKNQMLARGYTAVDSVFSGSFASQMLTNLNKGGTLFTYRGYLGMSGFSTTAIQSATNDFELPFAVILTCDTGSFSRDATCRSEAFLRGNATRNSGGAIGAIGTATIGTHTRYNDCMFHGIVHAVLNSGEHRLGPALTRGKMEMYNNYELAEPNAVLIWSTWNNLMGDSATEMWTGYPQSMLVSYPGVVAVGADAVTVAVHAGGLPLVGARVALYKAGQVGVSALTDAAGTVNLPLAGATAGAVLVTVTEHGHRPYLGSLSVGSPTDWLALDGSVLDDDAVGGSAGNGDGHANPGEVLEITPRLGNRGTTTGTGVTATLATIDPFVSVSVGSVGCADLAPGANVLADAPLIVGLSASAPDGHVARCDLTLTDAAGSWSSLLEIAVQAPALVAGGTTFGGAGGTPDPGETGSLTVTLINQGSVALAGATATLKSDTPWVTITDGSGAYGAIGIGMSGTNAGDPFAISVAPDCFRGHLATFTMDLTYAGGGTASVEVTCNIGTAATTDPVGPDRHGYYAFDNSDVSYPDAPVFSWVEIDPGLGGAGTSVGLTDYADEQDDTRTVNLAFPFTYYGKTYDKVSICSNGWFAFGSTYLKLYRNFSIPSAGCPDAMVAVFWDSLYLNSSLGGVFTWYDAANNRLVIEWSRLINLTGGTETFEAILYDPAHYPTDTGDGIIGCQYQTVNQTDGTNGYATVGIQNEARDDGVLYTYWNQYPAAAAALQTGRAIRFLPIEPVDPGFLAGHVTNASASGAPIAGAQVRVVEKARSLITASDGAFFGSVPPGTYTIVAEHASFAPDTLTAVSIAIGQTTNVEFALVDIAPPSISATTALTSTNDTVGPYVVETNITDFSPLASRHFYYATSQGGGTQELPLVLVDAGAGLYRAEIPGQPAGTWIQYWVEAADVAGHAASDPAGQPWEVYGFGVGNVTVIFTDDMETNHSWSVGGVGDTATTGLWVRVDPNGIVDAGRQVQPEDDSTIAPGVTCWVTGNAAAGSAQGTEDVDGGQTTLTSPQLSLAGYQSAIVSYKRWYTNDTGNAPGEDVWNVDVSGDGGVNWVSLESTNVSDRSWSQHGFELAGLVPFSSNVRFRFIATDSGQGSVVEAGVDDFQLVGYLQPVDTQGPSVAVVAPDGGEELLFGNAHEPFTMQWTASDNLSVVRTALVLSRDGGTSWPDTLVQGPLAVSYDWLPVGPSSTTCRLKVVCWDSHHNVGADVSAADFTVINVTAVGDLPATPVELALLPNRPNPFNPSTEIRFTLPAAGRVAVKVYDTAGRLVATLAEGERPAGAFAVVWEGTDASGAPVASGTYFCRLESAGRSLTRKLMLVK